MTDGRHFERRKMPITQPLFDIFTIFVTLVAMDCHGTSPKVTFQLRQNPRWRQAGSHFDENLFAMGSSIR